jgi:hypothetical protein
MSIVVATVDYLAGAIELLSGIDTAAKRLEQDPDTLREWLKRGGGHVQARYIFELSDKSGVPLSLMRTRRYRGPRLEGNALKKAALCGVEAYHGREALGLVKHGLESVSGAIRNATKNHDRVAKRLRIDRATMHLWMQYLVLEDGTKPSGETRSLEMGTVRRIAPPSYGTPVTGGANYTNPCYCAAESLNRSTVNDWQLRNR